MHKYITHTRTPLNHSDNDLIFLPLKHISFCNYKLELNNYAYKKHIPIYNIEWLNINQIEAIENYAIQVEKIIKNDLINRILFMLGTCFIGCPCIDIFYNKKYKNKINSLTNNLLYKLNYSNNELYGIRWIIIQREVNNVLYEDLYLGIANGKNAISKLNNIVDEKVYHNFIFDF